ncbi:DUF2946 family protein [Metapseudomonas otitidis]|nr:DUF2946 family protein [Pseudomonas otitidis]
MAHYGRMRFGAWLGLLALWLVVAGPLLSQVRAQAGELPAWLAEMACASGRDSAKLPAHPDHLLAKCGYCTLLSASPALTPAPLLPALLPATAFFASLEPEAGHGAASVFPGARPRAPPSLA